MTSSRKNFSNYALLDSGDGRKLERFGSYLLARPCAQAVWQPKLPARSWQEADASFSREGENKWTHKRPLPSSWDVEIAGLIFKLASTDFGHLGVFPEQKRFWEWMQTLIVELQPQPRVLNLFAYSGGMTLAAAKAGAAVCHLDASKGMVTWARENTALNGLQKAPIRWIIEDVHKFLLREQKRQSRYEGIILDPPSFGRGSKGELFKIETDIVPLLRNCRNLLSERPAFLLFSCHTPGFTPLVMHHLLEQTMQGMGGEIDAGELVLQGEGSAFDVPSGTYARWVR